MPAPRMHPDEVSADAALVRRLVAEQFPRWAGLPVTPVASSGTDHHLHRLGDHLVARLPRIAWATAQAATEARWLPRLAPQLPLTVPVPVAMGRPGHGYPFTWSVVEWLPGRDASGGLDDLDRAATDLAAFVTALRRADAAGAHPRAPGARGAPLAELDDQLHRAVADLGEEVDRGAVLRAWDAALEAPRWGGSEVWVHGDLLPGNLLVVDGRLAAVIDFGGLNTGDPACDLQPAWHLFTGRSRARFREALEADDAAWARGRGWILYQTVSALAYYRETNPAMVRQSWHALAQVLADRPA